MTTPLIVFRCDASPLLGAGHVARCTALAESLREQGWRIVFVTGPETLSSFPQLSEMGFEVKILDQARLHDPAAIHAVLGQRADFAVIDHYDYDAGYERRCRAWCDRVVVFDDGTGRRHDCDVLIDSAVENGAASYASFVPPNTELLTGPEFALLRRQFLECRERALARRDSGAVNRILVSYGASDPVDATSVTLAGIRDLATSLQVTVAISSKAPHLERVRSNLGPGMRLQLDVTNMAELMTESDIAIGAGGATAYERAVLGLPAIVVAIVENQRGVCGTMVKAGAALDGGELDDGLPARIPDLLRRLVHDGSFRLKMSQAASALIDGRGALRISNVFERMRVSA